MTTSNATTDADARRCHVADSIASAQAEALRQQEAIRQLAAENDKLKKEVASMTGVPYDYVKADKFSTLKGEVDALERRYQFEKMKKNELTKQYQIARIDLLQSRRLKGGVNAEKENAEALQRQVEILENRLDRALTKFNDAISYNKELRDHINIIRKERRVFQRVYTKLENDLRAKKKFMSERIEQSNRDLDERDAYLRQVEQLEKAIKEQKQGYDEQVREMDEAMVEINDMRDEQQRLELEFEVRQYETSDHVDSMTLTSLSKTGDLNARRRPRLDDRTDTPLEDFNEGGDGKESLLEQEPNLNDVLIQLQDFAQDGDLIKLAKQYESLGDTNFSLYKFINELTTSREEMERDIRTLKSAIAAEHESEERQRCLIRDLEQQLAETEELLGDLQSSREKHMETLAEIRGLTEEIFNEFGCSAGDGATPMIGGVTQCTESNHLQFLGLIEQRATAIMCAFQIHQRQEALRAELEAQQRAKGVVVPKENTSSANDAAEEEADPTLTQTANSQHGETEDLAGDAKVSEMLMLAMDEDVSSCIPMVQVPRGQSISAVRLVRQSYLPSAHLGHDESSDAREEGEGDRVISHEEMRRQMERRLMLKREREERAQRKKREQMDQMTGQTSASRKRT